MLYLIFFVLLLFLVPDVYIYFLYTRGTASAAWTFLLLAPTALAVLTLGYTWLAGMSMTAILTFFDLTLCIALPKLLFFAVDGVLRLASAGLQVCKIPGFQAGGAGDKAHVIPWVALVLALALFAVQCYGTFFGNKRLTVKQTEVSSAQVPAAFDGYRIAQISDLHLGTYSGDTAIVQRIVDQVNALQPDLVVFTGDLVNTSADEVAPYVHTLADLHARDGVLSILGNHDYCLYRLDRDTLAARHELEELCQKESADLGWRLLRNEHVLLTRERADGNGATDSLYIVGVENIGRPPFPKVGNLEAACMEIPPTKPCILLSHDPFHWRAEVVSSRFQQIFLTLSGHTHALQLRLGSWSPARYLMPEWGGLYRKGDQQLYVSTGLGGSVPYRFGAWPQVEIITLRATE